MKQIPIYKTEKELGLAEEILAKSSISYCSPVSVNKNPNEYLLKHDMKVFSAILNRAEAVNKDQIDLFYLKDILVSTGWNLNDDVFTLSQTWSARNTAEDKQFNLGHNQKEIIGHMTSQYPIDAQGNVLDSTLAIDELPDKFHIVSSSVIYRFWPEPEYMAKINNIIAEIEAQGDDKPKWFVSMEALFDDFDYALMDGNKKQVIIPRTEASAFLTKHLRAYGGGGVYNNYRVGRVLKNIVFSGKGLVENPANPESVIFNDTTPFKASASEINFEILQDLGYANNSNVNLKETDLMNETELLKKQLDEAKAALKAEQTAKADLEKKLTDEANKSIQAKVDELTKTVEAAKAKTVEVEASLKAKDVELVEANKKLVEVNDKLAKANEQLTKIENEKRVLARKTELVTKLGLKDDVAADLVETLSVLNDEAFAKYVEKSPKPVAATQTQEDEEKKKTEAAKAEAAKKALENAEPNKDTGSANLTATADVEETRKKIRDTYAASKGKDKNIEQPKK